jgi:Caspase domain
MSKISGRRRLILAAGLALLATASIAAAPGPRRALLIGINDYSASALDAPRNADVPQRDWTNLDGAVNDVRLVREILIARYGFAPADIVTLTDQQATRAAILGALDKHLLRPARKGDVLLVYYSGHGSQVRNSLSKEADKLDESFVPADSRRGARDIRDKEWSVTFNRMLDRGARLTVILDACHSGSGARGLSGGLRHRGVAIDLRDAADATDVPRPEDRGALVMAAAEDFDLAYETIDGKQIRGAFSWAFARALRDADPGEPASDTFLRAAAFLRTEMPAQNPVLAGRAEIRLASFLGDESRRRNGGRAIAVEDVFPDGTCTLLGGWVHGLTVGTRLQGSGVELEVTSLIGAGRATARIASTNRSRGDLRRGTLLEVRMWAAPPLRKMRLWIPLAPSSIVATARDIATAAAARGTHFIDDPTDGTPDEVIRWRRDAWETISAGRSALTLFVQVPATPIIASAADGIDGIELVESPETADYILTGRLTPAGIEYAWVRPCTIREDGKRTPMPLRTAWMAAANEEVTVLALRDALLRLIRIRNWHELTSPAGNGSHYGLAIRDARDGALVENGPLVGEREYKIVLRLRGPRPATPLYARYVYVFAIDSNGRGILLFPRSERGSVENRFPLTESASQPVDDPPAEIALGDRPSSFIVLPPYGMDSYFLLSTDTPLSGASCLEWDGVRTPSPTARTPLEMLLAQPGGSRGGEPIRTSSSWSIEKIVFESVSPKRGSP